MFAFRRTALNYRSKNICSTMASPKSIFVGSDTEIRRDSGIGSRVRTFTIRKIGTAVTKLK